MKQWAIKTPRGKIIGGTMSDTRINAWDYAIDINKALWNIWMCDCSNISEIKNAVQKFKAKGYRCVRVNVTEVVE